MDKYLQNIRTIQQEVKYSVNHLLEDKGYNLVLEEIGDIYPTLLLRWTNPIKKHSYEMIWDIKERWFNICERGNYQHTTDTNIGIYPYRSGGKLFRKRYNKRYLKRILEDIKKL